MTTALEVMTKAARILQDMSFKRWTQAEMLDWVSEAQVVVSRNPGVYNVTTSMNLVTGARQTLPNDGWSLITVRYNLDGTQPVSAIKLTTRELLDAYLPMWHHAPNCPLVENYIYDDRTPKSFFVYPPNDGTGKVELVYAAVPAKLQSNTDTLVIDDVFVPAIVNYVVYRAYCKESDFASGVTNAQGYLQAYLNEVNAALQSRGMTTPNAALMPNTIVSANGSTE